MATPLPAKFRGCMVGALLGDCIGAPFEFHYSVPEEKLNKFLNTQMEKQSDKKLTYTDDTAMAISVASSLAEKKEMDPKDMAKKFVDSYFKEPGRGYSGHATTVFKTLRKNNFDDIYLPATLQFFGEGSFGNGAAMRIAPVALFGNNKGEEYIVNAVKQCALITHSHPNGYNGAILQCLAVNAALNLDPSQVLDPVQFTDNLLEKMEKIEAEDTNKPYCESLKKVKEFIQREDVSNEEIVEVLGNARRMSALKTVPTAIYSFLRGMKPLQEYQSSNPFMRTLVFAISLGGDTDTIGTMAGSIAGAYYGVDLIPVALQKRCEAIDKITVLADKLFKVTQKKRK